MQTIKYRWELINRFIFENKYKRYLEIGLDEGFCFRQVWCDTKVSVDPAEDNYTHAIPTYKMTSDIFFDTIAPDIPKFDIIFIDGLHHSEQVDTDILNGLKHLNNGGTIILHDCNPLTKEAQDIPRSSRVWNGDVWKSIVTYRTKGKWNAFTLNTDEGLGVIQKGIKPDYKITLPENWDDWINLDENRIYYLGLIDPELLVLK